jgi:hypothetical protein
MIGTWCRDDSFDWTEGWQGKAQFVIATQRADEADRGNEADNNATLTESVPRSHPVVYNMTLIGDPTTTYGAESTQGMMLRVGTAGDLHNVIVTGFKSYGIRVDDASTYNQGTLGELVVSGIVSGNNNGGAQFNTNAQNLINGGYWTNIHTVDPMLCNPTPVDIYGYIDATKQYKPNFAPAPGSPAINGSVPVDAPPVDGFFEPVDFVGAVDPDNDWTYGWTTFGAAKQLVSDLNYSNSVTITDCQKALRIASGRDPIQGCADANNSGGVTVTDAQKCLRYASGRDPVATCCTE